MPIGIYDIMAVADGDHAFPVSWATDPEGSSVASPATCRAALEAAGFDIIAERNRRDFALEFFAQLQARAATAEGPPPLGLHIPMGSTAPVKFKNTIDGVSRNVIAPIGIIAEKAL